MSALRFAIRSFGRELRSGEVLVLLAAVSLAVAALTAVGFLTDRIGKAVARQANEVLAADLRLRSAEPIPDEWRELAAEFELAVSDPLSFPTVVFGADSSALASLKAVDDAYPLRGAMRISDGLFTEQREVDTIPAEGEVWADAALLARLDSATMEASLEARVPYTDHHLVEKMFRVPHRHKISVDRHEPAPYLPSARLEARGTVPT